MARKRKIPTRKHHGVRDPLKQQAERLAKLKGVINNPPAKGGDQKVSKKFAEFQKLSNSAKRGKKFKRIQCGIEDKPRVKNPRKPATANGTTTEKIRPIKQLSGEADEDYLRRVNRMTTESLKEAEYEAKYGVSVVRDKQTGDITIKKKPLNEIDELLKRKRSRKPIEKKSAKMDPKLAKELIKQAIKEVKEETKEDAIKEFTKDVFKFGEVVHAPPTLTTLPRKAVRSETTPRPGKKDNLLLKSLLKDPNEEDGPKVKSSTLQVQKDPKQFKGKLKGKRKDLPAATRVMIEQEQNKVIDLYRKLKKNKTKTFGT